ncbi:hypothetical protein ACVLD2_001253 [Paenibacillus sp. PvR052]|nr:hypothetical protein [Paenibacillus sp. PvP091]MBP1169777.1 hypothetical protein [Paenibacillus sp. PvR098]MBP2440805.1 hypothetical protein [Paenibacillus sp. PvP052]
MLERNTEKLIVGAALAFAASTLWISSGTRQAALSQSRADLPTGV